jgi:hypothetical protein
MDFCGLPVRFLSTQRTFADSYGRAGSSRGFESHLLRFPSQSASHLDSKIPPAYLTAELHLGTSQVHATRPTAAFLARGCQSCQVGATRQVTFPILLLHQSGTRSQQKNGETDVHHPCQFDSLHCNHEGCCPGGIDTSSRSLIC